MSRFIDLSHPIEEGMETYRPLPTPRVDVLNDYDASRYDGKSEFLIASLHVCGNTGTYVDSPRHRYRQGVDLAGLPLERPRRPPDRGRRCNRDRPGDRS